MKHITQEEFEKAVMTAMLEKESPVNSILKKQYESCSLIKRTFTGVGFFADFNIPDTTEQVKTCVNYDYCSAFITINGIEGFDCILFVKDGKLICLEGCTYLDTWPTEIYNFTIKYVVY